MEVQVPEVIIVGGGPVGFCLALLLAERGIETTLIEQDKVMARELRASTFHPPTLDLLAPLGITAELLARGEPCPTWQIRLHPSGERAVFDLGVLQGETDYPFRLQCEQWKLTEALRDRIAGKVEILCGARFTGLRQAASDVEVEIEQDGEGRRLRCQYLIGCDGARSSVRGIAGLAFEGETYPETTILVTTTFAFEDHLPGLSNVSYCWKEEGGNFTLLKAPERWRVSIYPSEDRSLEAQLEPSSIDGALQQIVARSRPYEIGEMRPYRVHMRLAARYDIGRVAIAGDAAHVNNPAGGMGLNGGLHDAFELASALIAVLREGADDSRLDLYDRRRRPVARDEILLQADRNRARMREADPVRRREMLAQLQATASDPLRCKAHLMRSSMIEGLRRAAAIV
jgi:3-(3-hydroxy-phenyl)propionate hydroxylase